MTYQRALITGGAGLIGSHIADRLVAEGFHEIVVLDNLTRGRRENLAGALSSGRVTIVEGDIRDRELVMQAMEGIDIVFHEAAIRITHCAENPRLAHDVLATGTFNVLEADEMGCHIITAPADILKKLPALGTKTGAELSLDAVKAFRADAIAAGLTLELAPRADAAE